MGFHGRSGSVSGRSKFLKRLLRFHIGRANINAQRVPGSSFEWAQEKAIVS